mgnify:CR=1 FL=1
MKNKFWGKMLALTLSAAVVAGCGAFAGCNNNSDSGNKIPETQKIEDLSDDRYVNLYGRNYYNENYEGTTFINSASGFELKFRGTAVYADICVIGSRDSMWSVFVDGETDSNARVLTFKKKRGMFTKKTLVEGLPGGEHTLKILKRTMSSADYAVIKNLASDGAFLGAPEKPKLHIAFYGDSITCGSGVLREYKPADSKIYTAETQNALQSYAAYCASELGASFSVFGRGGITLKFKNAATEAFSVLDNYKSMAVDLSVAQGECPEYDFAVVPDAVVIYLGTNDYLRSLKYTTGYSLSGMQAALIEFVDKLGAYYGTDMPIVLCSGMMVHNSGLAGAVSGAAQTLKPKYPYIAALDFDAGVTESVGGHPVVEDSVKAGAQLAQTLKTLFVNSGRILD